MPDRQSWSFIRLPKVWIWKTRAGYMAYSHDGEEFIMVFPSAEAATATAKASGMLGHPEPLKTPDLWRSAISLKSDNLCGYAWLDEDTFELYRVTDLPVAALDLAHGHTGDKP